MILQQKAANPTSDQALVILALFQVAENLDPHFNMPILTRTSPQYVVAKAKVCSTHLTSCMLTKLRYSQDIRFIFNAQHHCKSGNCKIRSRTETQERQQTTRTVPYMDHADDNKFLINMHAIHNASLIRETVKNVYGGPKPYFGTDRQSHHNAAAARLRVSGPKKRAEANKKRKATRERNKAAQQAQVAEEAKTSLRMHGDVADTEVLSEDSGSESEGEGESESEVESETENEDLMDVN